MWWCFWLLKLKIGQEALRYLQGPREENPLVFRRCPYTIFGVMGDYQNMTDLAEFTIEPFICKGWWAGTFCQKSVLHVSCRFQCSTLSLRFHKWTSSAKRPLKSKIMFLSLNVTIKYQTSHTCIYLNKTQFLVYLPCKACYCVLSVILCLCLRGTSSSKVLHGPIIAQCMCRPQNYAAWREHCRRRSLMLRQQRRGKSKTFLWCI